ncbi:calcium-binding protein [Rubrimonas cliftonensis]|uniref:Hemolysin-type calcium-binding repeat-containing protein n=1 Tax=Rubrimonas cliftonensis TaxID=89524 RepID=A0A1H4GDK4_9RHOB|nr:calcium-binding protein [Rubrimonas cliftonensis]SEB06782.1 Hemolysin-type calcium-binding repeat-containing protein [Rubrimonas cliftonensis]
MATFNGGNGPDPLTGTEGDDVINGLGGDDTIRGLGGNDVIDGGTGGNRIDGGAGDDTITSRGGEDALFDIVEGGPGNDLIRVEGPDGTVFPGTGNDTVIAAALGTAILRYDGFATPLVIDFAAGTATTTGMTDALTNIDRASGGDAADTLLGGLNDDYEGFDDSPGGDFIDGRGGFDELIFNIGDVGPNPIVIDFAAGTVRDTFLDTDTFQNIEAVRATLRDDEARGSDQEYERYRMLAGDDTVIGGGGIDEVDYSRDANYGGPAGVTVNLATGTAVDGWGDTDSLSGVERVRGTDSADRITGDGADNRLRGLGGDDTLDGGAGVDELEGGDGDDSLVAGGAAGNGDRDRLRGGAGDDTLVGVGFRAEADYRFGHDDRLGVVADLAAGTATDPFGDVDRLIGISRLRGTAGDDTLLGDDRNNGLRGDDGADLIDGRGGFDFAMFGFTDETEGAVVDLAAETVANDGHGNVETIRNIEVLVGTRFADVFRGSAEDEFFEGYEGDDLFDGRGGFDTASYLFEEGAQGVVADLTVGTATDTHGDTDTLISIEGLEGTDRDDTLRGDAGDNSIDGEGGADLLTGGAGDDSFRGGVDDLDGDVITDFRLGSVLIVEGAVFGFSALTFTQATGALALDIDADGATDAIVTLQGVDVEPDFFITAAGDATEIRLTGLVVDPPFGFGTEGPDRITGTPGPDRIDALGGNDTVKGFADADDIDLGTGDDIVLSSGGADTIRGGAGADTIKSGDGADSIDGGDGNDIILSGNDDDTILGGAGDDTIKPGRGDDSMDGGAGDDILVAFRGDEVLIGGDGNDTLLGNLDDDTLIGGAGDDRMQGGPGRDTFVFDTPEWGDDRIVLDFLPQSDTLDFRGSGLGFADLSITQAGDNVLIEAGDSSILVNSARFGPLDVADFTGDVLLFG